MPVSSEIVPPHNLGLVIDFVNTFEAERDIEELSSPAALADWLAARQLLQGPASSIRGNHLAQALRLREALRALMGAHNGFEPVPDAARELEAVSARGRLTVSFDEDGTPRLLARDGGFAGTLARLLIPLVESSADGTWERVKACRADDCRWAFYDHSRNRSGAWCDMAVCGNRTKVRAYRARRSEA